VKIRHFSPKQRQVLLWWCTEVHQDRDAVICDGAVRSGKTICMGLSFFCWAMAKFDSRGFALCGKTIQSVRRNLLHDLLPLLRELGFDCQEQISRN